METSTKKNATGQGDHYTTGCLIDYLHFKENDRLAAIYLSKQQKLDAGQKQYKKSFFLKCRMRWDYRNVFHY